MTNDRLPWYALPALALLAVPRVVLHDLHVIEEGSAVNALLVFGPPVVWIAVVLRARVANPFLTLLAVGAWYGLFLALGHQVLWEASFGDDPPRLGGNLAGRLSPGAEQLVLRAFAAVSSLFTGVLVGAVSGLAGWGLTRLMRGRVKS